jgi:hypothetical protein
MQPEQPELFDLGITKSLYGEQGDVPFEVTSTTSAAAAESIESELNRLESAVYEVIRWKPMTCDAIELVTGFSHQPLCGTDTRQRRAEESISKSSVLPVTPFPLPQHCAHRMA